MRRTLNTLGALAIVGTLLSPPQSAAAKGVYFDSSSLLTSFFPTATRVNFEKVDSRDSSFLSEVDRRILAAAPTANVFVAYRDDVRSGYALILEERGQHLPITFGIRFDLQGAITRTEVMVYRENYGEQIRAPQFRRQFAEKTAADPLRLGDDISVITGATISSHSMARAVKRAALYVKLLRARISDHRASL